METFNTIVGVLGLGVSIVGLWLTHAQARQAKNAAEAARDAAKEVLDRSRKDFMMYVARNIGNLLTELNARFQSNDYAHVATRLGDLHKEIIVISAYSKEFAVSQKRCATLQNQAEAADTDELKTSLKKSFATFHRKLLVLISKQTLPETTAQQTNA